MIEPGKNYTEKQNLEFYEWIKSLKLTDKEIEERKRILDLDEESQECAKELTRFQRKKDWRAKLRC